jgi:uncharacterized protein YsxB (DUF464 family)
MDVVGKGLASIAFFFATGIIEVIAYSPMLGAAGTYLSFVTGNIMNLKMPCALNALENAKVKANTEEGEVITTIAICSSIIVTTIVIVIGVVLLAPLQPVLQSETLLPAFNNVVPALFGALGIKYFLKSPKIAVIPLLLMSLLCIFVPSMISQTSILIIPSGGLALLIGFVLFKKGKV